MNQSGEEQVECPLCMEPLEVDDLHFYPCTCGYQICRFCWNRIREGENGLCPACRKAYPENPADFTPLSQEQVAAMKTEKRAREQQRRTKTQESRRQLSSVRVVQKNLVFVVGLPVRLADPEVLKRQEYFGKYGKIHKVVINHSTAYAGSQGPSASAYVTYVSSADALRAIQNVNNVTIDGRVLKGSLGTTKYCANFMRNQPCPKPDCMYLHELGDSKASFTKEEMHQGLHQVYEKKLHNQLLALPAQPPSKDSPPNSTIQSGFIPTTVVCNTSSSINIANPKWQSNPGNGNMNINMHSNGNGNGSGPLMLSSSSSSSDSSSSRDAWPSLSSSPLHTQDSTPSPQPSGGEGAERGEPEGCGAPEEDILESVPDRAEVNDNRGNGDGADKRNRSQRRGRRDAGNPAINDDHSQDNDSSLESLNDRKAEEVRNERPVEGAEERSFGVPEKHDLLDGDDHNLLEDDGSHDLLDDPDASDGPARFAAAALRDRSVLDFAPAGSRPFPDGLRSGPSVPPPLPYGLRERFGDEPPVGLDFRTLPPFGMRTDRAPPLVSGRSAMEEQETEGGRYAGENSMDKFFIDFHKNQQLKFLMSHAAYARQPPAPTPRPMTSLAYIENQHINRLSAIQHSQDTGLSQMQSELANDKFTNNTVDDDLDFDPFKETQKALAEMMEHEVLLQQNGPKCSSDSANAESATRRSRHPPPGFTHMNAFGIGVPRPQPQPQPQPTTGFGQGGGVISDWTQMDPAIVSTGCNTFSQHPPTNAQQLQQQLQHQLQRQQMQLRQMQQQPSPQQQRDLYSRFGRGSSVDTPKSPFDFSDMPPRQMMAQHPRIHQQNGMMPQQHQQQQQQQSMMNGHPANGSQRFFSFPSQQRKPDVANWMMPNFNSAEGPFAQQNRNGFYRSDSYAPMDDGMLDSDKFSSVPLLRDPPGFSSVQGQGKAAAGGPECIESK